ncbi:uncharacterized protein LOC131070717 isoform X1 [Cryptomeria japonica]|uniref:uncharacterized protein LOC131070717 isoform X1 n=1 Tax=Cryptomeria japonica TaxID=3369 RepID=UPI0025ACDBB5|nr:uncharacterized protein LOC131070717 isoform X1 [Cryptomeria japonica]
MYTVFDGGRPIISFNGDWDNDNNNNNFSATSTVVLDPAAFLANWKKQIQGKLNIPVNQQRLTFASNHRPYPGINLFNWNCASQDQSANEPVVGNFVTCLQSWQAILRSDKRNIARLLHPEVLTESDNLPSDLKSKTAEEIRDLGIPCSVYYLSFDKCILASQSQTCQGESQDCREVSNLCIKVNKDFHSKEFEVDLYGRLSKRSHPLHFQYRLIGRHLVAHLSTLEQTVHYRQGQKIRHSSEKGKNSVDEVVDGNTTETLINKDRAFALVKQTTSQDIFLPGSIEQDLVAVFSQTLELRQVRLVVVLVGIETLIKLGIPSSPSFSGSHKNGKEDAQTWNSNYLLKSTKINELSEAKTAECTKKKGMISGKSKDSKSEKDSSNFQTDRVNACSSTEKCADTSKFDDTSKKPSKKKKKKGKNKLKHSGGHTQVPILKESSEESSLASGSNVASTCGSGCITVRNNDVTSIHKNNIKDASDPELCSTSKGETADMQLSCKNSAPLSQETSAEEFSASAQSARGFVGVHTDSSVINGNGSIHDPSNTKFGSVNKGRRLPDSHSTGNWTRLPDFPKSTSKTGGSPNGHLHAVYSRPGSDGVNNIETGNSNGICSVDSHDKSKHIPKVGRSRETQTDDKKFQVARGKKVAGSNFGLVMVNCSSGSMGSCGIGSVQSRVGKESNQSVWQKVQKNTLNDHIQEPKDSEYRQLPSALYSNNVLSAVNLNSEKNSAFHISPKCSREYGNVLSKHSKQKSNDSWNRRDSHDPLTRVRVKEDSNRSQCVRDDNSGWSRDGKTTHITRRDATKTGKDFEEKKTGCCCSEIPIQSSQKGTLHLSCQNNHPRRSTTGDSNISHQNTETHDTDRNDEWKSSLAPSTPCQNGDALQPNRDDFTLASTSSPIQGQLNWMFSSSRVSNSSDQVLMPTKNPGDQMTSALHISDVQLVDGSSFHSPFQKESKSMDVRLRVSGENDLDQCFNLQHVAQEKVPVGAISAAMVMACTPNTGAVDTQYMDIENNDCEVSNETHKLHALSKIGLKSPVSVEETDACNHVGQMNVVNNQHVFEVSCRCPSYISLSASSSNVEFENMAQAISGSILTSYESQLALESITHALGGPLAEFEKVLDSVSPEIKSLPCADKCSSHSKKLGITNLVCRCQIADIPLTNIWHWFEEVGNYGLEVKAEEFRQTGRSSIDGFFRAYFVPYLSGIQLFGFSGSSQSFYKGAANTERQETNEKINKVEDSYLSHFANLPILSTLLPKPFAAETTSAPVCLCSADTSNISSNADNYSCSTLLSYSRHGEMEILFEFFESQLPQQRRPMFEKIRELINGDADSSSQSFGDPHILESIKLQDLHPASWFSVAWYPIYRIPEGQLRAAFLTYHSLGHFVHRDTSSTLVGDIGSCIVAPVVGLQSYSAQAEGWFMPRKQFEHVMKGNISANPSDVLRERLKTLEETASTMARGCAKKDRTSVISKQSDYEFFLSRRR